jgi:predicted urease superfamily metal-dependent hydrolase
MVDGVELDIRGVENQRRALGKVGSSHLPNDASKVRAARVATEESEAQTFDLILAVHLQPTVDNQQCALASILGIAPLLRRE